LRPRRCGWSVAAAEAQLLGSASQDPSPIAPRASRIGHTHPCRTFHRNIPTRCAPSGSSSVGPLHPRSVPLRDPPGDSPFRARHREQLFPERPPGPPRRPPRRWSIFGQDGADRRGWSRGRCPPPRLVFRLTDYSLTCWMKRERGRAHQMGAQQNGEPESDRHSPRYLVPERCGVRGKHRALSSLEISKVTPLFPPRRRIENANLSSQDWHFWYSKYQSLQAPRRSRHSGSTTRSCGISLTRTSLSSEEGTPENQKPRSGLA